ncbi:NUDIX hydrolase [bacterium]|nr:MAG: NUDIX hydrolase [bacterium]
MNITNFPYKNGPWTILSRKLAYDGKYAKLYEDEVVRPDGTEGIHIYLPTKDGVSILPYDKDGNVYLISIFRYSHQDYLIELTAGGIDKGEDHLIAAKRELKEETGIVGKNYELVAITAPKSEIYSAKDYTYICEVEKFEENRIENTENIKLIKMKLKDALGMVDKLEIFQASAIIALLKLKDKFNKTS